MKKIHINKFYHTFCLPPKLYFAAETIFFHGSFSTAQEVAKVKIKRFYWTLLRSGVYHVDGWKRLYLTIKSN